MNIQPCFLPITNQKVVERLCRRDLLKWRLLDLGCGSGYFTSLSIDRLKERGIKDYTNHVYAVITARDDFVFRDIECVSCDFNKTLPYEDDFFDAVCSIEVIEHLEGIFDTVDLPDLKTR